MPSTRRQLLRRLGGVGGAVTGAVVGGCARPGTSADSVSNVHVGSKPFAEQEILGYLAYHSLQQVESIQVVDEIGYGTTQTNWQATATGAKDLYWEYTGTAWLRLPPQHTERITEPQRLYKRVKADALAQDIKMGPPAQLSNGFVIAVDRSWHERTGVRTLSDLIAHFEAGNTEVGFAVGEDFYRRQDAWRGVTSYYGLEAETRATLETGTFIVTSIGLTYELLETQQVDVVSGFATDPQLDSRDIVVLEDDRQYFLPYQPVPTAHAPTIQEHPEIFDALRPVITALDKETVRTLSRDVLNNSHSPSAVAQEFLDRTGTIT